eukprot:TRINITY_DN2058_c0_g1_i7.p1 TRINITY_DN2058_c0_g1~~TRINITY_DN2058_c0_g1_i7.p1  ORF type:complete len:114 (-),score=34.02 TRINITY_DN2058_c0_g1_i7:19-360(-)
MEEHEEQRTTELADQHLSEDHAEVGGTGAMDLVTGAGTEVRQETEPDELGEGEGVDGLHGVDGLQGGLQEGDLVEGEGDGELDEIEDDLKDSGEIGRAVQQECRDRSRMPSSA